MLQSTLRNSLIFFPYPYTGTHVLSNPSTVASYPSVTRLRTPSIILLQAPHILPFPLCKCLSFFLRILHTVLSFLSPSYTFLSPPPSLTGSLSPSPRSFGSPLPPSSFFKPPLSSPRSPTAGFSPFSHSGSSPFVPSMPPPPPPNIPKLPSRKSV